MDDPDCDMFNDPSDVFQAKFKHTAELSVSKDYVLHLAPNSNFSKVATGSASSQVSILDASTAKEIHGWSPYSTKAGLTGLRFSPKNDSLVYSSSSTDSLKLWDLRSSTDKAVKVFRDTSAPKEGEQKYDKKGKPVGKKYIMSMDVNCDDTFIAAGTEQVVQDAFLLFWDVRCEDMLGGYWESFGDDVTTVKFHPANSDRLATGGSDGLLNVFDISQESEDDALLTALNPSITSVKSLTWFERKNDKEAIAATSDDEELVVWPRVIEGTAGEDARLTREDVTIGIRRKTPEWCFLIDAHASGSDGLMVLAKSTYPKSTCLRLATVKKSKLKTHADLTHPDAGFAYSDACSSAYDPLSGTVYVGDESGKVHWWTKQ